MIKLDINEQAFVNKVIGYLKPHFMEIKEQVWSRCHTGKIDLVLKYDNEIYFGVECKRPDEKKGQEIGEYVKQAIRYTNLYFEVEQGFFKKIPILICPPLSYEYFLMNQRSLKLPQHNTYGKNDKWHQDRHEETDPHHTFNGFLGAWGVGELRKSSDQNQIWYYISHSNKPVWSNKRKYFPYPKLSKEIEGVDRRWYNGWMKKINGV